MDWGIIVGWLISVIVLIAIIYFTVHAAVLGALKDHTKWVTSPNSDSPTADHQATAPNAAAVSSAPLAPLAPPLRS